MEESFDVVSETPVSFVNKLTVADTIIPGNQSARVKGAILPHHWN
jgi:hypothetical protein